MKITTPKKFNRAILHYNVTPLDPSTEYLVQHQNDSAYDPMIVISLLRYCVQTPCSLIG